MEVAFVGNSFHLTKTKSADFFIQLLRHFFGDVSVVPGKEAWSELPKRKWDLLVVWQIRFDPEELEAFGARHVVVVPMYDDVPHDEDFWRKYKRFKVFCFSSTLQVLLAGYGLAAWGARYYPEIPNRTATFGQDEGLRGFFWPRAEPIGLKIVRTLVGATPFSSMHVHLTPEIHGDSRVSNDAEALFKGKISISAWADRESYLDKVAASNVYFAPRVQEGIGMSFIEAMSMGLCLVAPRAPTMSEYIDNGVTGLLYDPSRAEPLDFSRAAEFGAAARASCGAGRARWLESLPRIKAFLEEPLNEYRPRLHPVIQVKGRSMAIARKLYRLMKKAF